jgi:hypothetical protein
MRQRKTENHRYQHAKVFEHLLLSVLLFCTDCAGHVQGKIVLELDS